jgi:hypothetical protein
MNVSDIADALSYYFQATMQMEAHMRQKGNNLSSTHL